MYRGISAVLALFLLGCGAEPVTALRVTVSLDHGVSIDQLRVTLAPEGLTEQPAPRSTPEAEPIASGHRVVLLVPDDWDGRLTRVTLVGLSKGKAAARGSGAARVARGEVVDLSVGLCADACPEGDTICSNNGVRTCGPDAGGCLRWGPAAPCPAATPFCSNGRCAAACEDECSSKEKRCVDGGYQVCGEHDKDSCTDWGEVISCGEKELCQGGECLPDCGGKPCACKSGETATCPDRGECRGGVRTCKDGVFGPCVWTVGPQAELCDGKDNDCNDTIDDADRLVAQACAKQQGVCQGALASCGGAAGWLACDDAVYAAQAKKAGLVYEASETLCDGKDNDCDGTPDEPAGCCQPSCAGKACGADDGCGNACQSGSCPPNATCKAGVCLCDHLSCGTSCCASGQVCKGSACCTPSCGARVCGPDPVCGTSCGTCSSGKSCDASGQCQGGCMDVGPLVLDSGGDVGSSNSLALDPNGKVHIGYHDDDKNDLKYATNASGAWTASTLDAAGGDDATSLAVDAAGKVHISYYNVTKGDLKYATNASGAWAISTLDAATGIGE